MITMPGRPRPIACAGAALLALGSLSAGPAAAAEPMVSYDAFGAATLDTTRWSSTERVRGVRSGALNLVQRDVGLDLPGPGSVSQSFPLPVADPGAVTQMRATFRVNAMSATGCAATGVASEARARLIGAFFNTGNGVSGSATGDVIAQVMVRKQSTTLPTDPYVVTANVNVCTNSDCSFSTPIGAPVALGTVALNTAVTLQLEWDRAAKRFVFIRDGGAFTGAVGYTQSDRHGPGNGYATVGSRTTVAHCSVGARPTAIVDVSVDNVALNRAALP